MTRNQKEKERLMTMNWKKTNGSSTAGWLGVGLDSERTGFRIMLMCDGSYWVAAEKIVAVVESLEEAKQFAEGVHHELEREAMRRMSLN
jgi:hypothetical protein